MRVIPQRWRRRPPRDPEGTMSLVEHLEELRSRLVISLIALGIGAVVGFLLFDRVIDLLQDPYCNTIVGLPRENRPPTGCDFVFLGLVDPVVIKLKVAAFV